MGFKIYFLSYKHKLSTRKNRMAKSKSKSSKTPNAWMAHVKQVGEKNPGMGLRDILVKAKASYKKEKHGGSLVLLPMLGGSKGQSGGLSALSPDAVSGMSHSSGGGLQMKATQFSGGKKSKRKRSGSKRCGGSKRRGSKRRH